MKQVSQTGPNTSRLYCSTDGSYLEPSVKKIRITDGSKFGAVCITSTDGSYLEPSVKILGMAGNGRERGGTHFITDGSKRGAVCNKTVHLLQCLVPYLQIEAEQ